MPPCERCPVSSKSSRTAATDEFSPGSILPSAGTNRHSVVGGSSPICGSPDSGQAATVPRPLQYPALSSWISVGHANSA